jgi:hypothetical protein
MRDRARHAWGAGALPLYYHTCALNLHPTHALLVRVAIFVHHLLHPSRCRPRSRHAHGEAPRKWDKASGVSQHSPSHLGFCANGARPRWTLTFWHHSIQLCNRCSRSNFEGTPVPITEGLTKNGLPMSKIEGGSRFWPDPPPFTHTHTHTHNCWFKPFTTGFGTRQPMRHHHDILPRRAREAIVSPDLV